LGDATQEELLSFTADQGWLEAYATLFDLEKGTVAAENAHIHAPGGILTVRLDKDENEDLFSEKLYTQNGSTLLVRGSTTLRGPWHHRGDFLTSFLVLNSPKDHLFEAATGRVLKDCELNDQGGSEIGSVPTLSIQRTYTHSQRQSLLPESFNLTITVMSENLRRLMAQTPQ
jgi:hypothetical protein